MFLLWNFFFKLTLQKNNWAAFEGLDKEENWKTDSIYDTQFTILENLSIFKFVKLKRVVFWSVLCKICNSFVF